jgi:hypothetical protein
VRLGNKGAGGPFAPLVVVVRNIVGEKEFNKLRGKAISLHSQGAGPRRAGGAARLPWGRQRAAHAAVRRGARPPRAAHAPPPAALAVAGSHRGPAPRPAARAAPPCLTSSPPPLPPAVIKDFCKQVGVDNKQVQAVVRLAKKNGEWLGFLA